jgi:hypothetical protein
MISFTDQFGEMYTDPRIIEAANRQARWRSRVVGWAYTLLTFCLFALLGVLAAWRI